MKAKEIVEAFDSVLFYSHSIGGGSVFLHPDDLDRYIKALPKERVRQSSDDDSFDAWVYHPVKECRFSSTSIGYRALFKSEHTSLGMARIGYGNDTKRPHVIYRPEGQLMTVAEYSKKVDDFLTKHEPLWNPVYMNPEDIERYLGGWGQQRFAGKPFGNNDKTLHGMLKFGRDERCLYAAPWVTLGTLVIGHTYSQTTHTFYMWSVPPEPGSRFTRDVDV